MVDCYDSLKRQARSIQDENKSLMTALTLLNNEFVNETKYRNGENEDFKEQNLHEEETRWEKVCDNKTMPRNKRERQMPNEERCQAVNLLALRLKKRTMTGLQSSLETP